MQVDHQFEGGAGQNALQASGISLADVPEIVDEFVKRRGRRMDQVAHVSSVARSGTWPLEPRVLCGGDLTRGWLGASGASAGEFSREARTRGWLGASGTSAGEFCREARTGGWLGASGTSAGELRREARTGGSLDPPEPVPENSALTPGLAARWGNFWLRAGFLRGGLDLRESSGCRWGRW